MKTNGTLVNVFIAIACFFVSVSASAQADYVFKNSRLESGQNLKVNAVYRFPSVKTGVDALVKITNMTGGFTMTNIDRTADGFGDAFQPEYRVPAILGSGYVEFLITFVQAGTNNVAIQSKVNTTALDIDGATGGAGNLLKLYEFNMIDMGTGLIDYNTVGKALAITTQGTAYTATNTTGVMVGSSVDTAQDIRYTVLGTNVSSITYRVGSNNLIGSSTPRYASLYFQRMNYSFSTLPIRDLQNFKATKKSASVELGWDLVANTTIETIIVEKAVSANKFNSIGEMWVEKDPRTVSTKFMDNHFSGTSYYRLKVINTNGFVEYSNVIVIRSEEQKMNNLKVYPSLITNSATVSVNAAKTQNTQLQVVDMFGRVLSKQTIQLTEGNNNISYSKPTTAQAGNYVIAISVDNQIQSQKVILQ